MVTVLFAFVVGLTIHEFAHSWAALKLGDNTPRETGRLTLNPLKHIDPFGFLLLLVAGFGWAKPVMINHGNLKNPKRDDLLISLAGPFSNLVFAFILTAVYKLILITIPLNSAVYSGISTTFTSFIWMNLGLFVFNMIPIPPLDGSHVITNFLSERNTNAARSYQRYGSFILIGIILSERITKIDLLPIGKVVEFFFTKILGIFGL
ncbi:MAG: site-2 protease family protein [Deltaproteobacteria bacterium]|nr:site-2 protease family protein [Deltaproteobacteria bacterium]